MRAVKRAFDPFNIMNPGKTVTAQLTGKESPADLSAMYTLYIGNKNYSTWSLRAWVLMKTWHPFAEKRILLYRPERPRACSATCRQAARVPCLHDGMSRLDTAGDRRVPRRRHPASGGRLDGASVGALRPPPRCTRLRAAAASRWA